MCVQQSPCEHDRGLSRAHIRPLIAPNFYEVHDDIISRISQFHVCFFHAAGRIRKPKFFRVPSLRSGNIMHIKNDVTRSIEHPLRRPRLMRKPSGLSIHRWECSFDYKKETECRCKKNYPCDPTVDLKMEDCASRQRNEHRQETNCHFEKDTERKI